MFHVMTSQWCIQFAFSRMRTRTDSTLAITGVARPNSTQVPSYPLTRRHLIQRICVKWYIKSSSLREWLSQGTGWSVWHLFESVNSYRTHFRRFWRDWNPECLSQSEVNSHLRNSVLINTERINRAIWWCEPSLRVHFSIFTGVSGHLRMIKTKNANY